MHPFTWSKNNTTLRQAASWPKRHFAPKRRRVFFSCLISLFSLYFFLPCQTLQAQPATVTNLYELTPLQGKWRFHAGDHQHGSRSDWDDRSWPKVTVPNERHQRRNRKHTIVWYRRTILMPKGFQAHQAPALGIALGEIRSAYELYANGQKIGQVGRLSPSPKGTTARHILHLIPPQAFQKNRLVIALRVWQPAWLLRYYGGKPRLGPSLYSFGLYKILKGKVKILQQRQREKIIVLLFVAFLLLLVALYHFHLYRGRAELSAYFWYGLLLICLAGWVAGKPLMKFFLVYNDSWGWILTRSTSFLAFFPAIEFAYRALDQQRPPKIWRICQWFSLGGFAVCLVLGPKLAPILPNLLLSLFFAGMLLGLLVYTIQRAWQGHPDARTIQGGMLVAFALLMWKYAISAKLLPYVSLPLPTMAFCILVLSLAFALSNQYRRTLSDLKSKNKELQEMNQAIQRFVPFEFLSHLGREDLRQVQRSDQNQLEMTTFFSDVRSFTSLVERMTPAETMRFVNRYLSAMEPPISKHNGFIDKYIGDAVMALFDRPDDALQASIDCLKALEDYNQQRIQEGSLPVHIGIGLHTGTLMLGTVGGENRLSCTVLGDSVNLASRIEGLTKLYNAPLLITGQTREKLKDPNKYQMQQVDRVAAKGKTQPVDLFEVWDGLSSGTQAHKQATTRDFQIGYQYFVQGDFQKAHDLFRALFQSHPQDKLVQLYVERCQHLLQQAPQEGWNGVVRINQK